MRHHHDRALERGEIILEDFQRGDVQIVGRLIQQQHIRRGHQQAGQIQPPLFAAGEPLHRGILHIRREEELLEHLRRGKAPVRRFHIFGDVAHEVDQAHVRRNLRKFLRKKADFHRFADGNRARIRRELTGEHAQQRRFAASIRPDDRHALIPQNRIGKIGNQRPPAERLADRLALDDPPPEPGAGRAEGKPLLLLRAADGAHLLKPLDARLLLGASGLRAPPNPLQLAAQDGASLSRRRVLHLQPRGLLFEIIRKVSVVQIQFAVADFRNAVAHAVEEVAVVRNHHQRAAILRQPPFQQGDGLRVDVVGRFIQHQQIDRADQRRRQRDALFLPAGERAHVRVEIVDAELAEQRLRLVFIRRADVLGRVEKHLLNRRARLAVIRHLRQIGDAQAVFAHDHAAVRLIQPRQQLEQRRFARAVDADHADSVVLADIDRHIGQQLF